MATIDHDITAVLHAFRKKEIGEVIRTVDPLIDMLDERSTLLKSDLMNLKGFSLLAQSEIEKAYSTFNASYRVKPDSWECLVGLAQINFLAECDDAALELLERANHVESGSTPVEMSLREFVGTIRRNLLDGLVFDRINHHIEQLIRDQKYREAEAASFDALKRYPENTILLNNHAVITALLKDFTRSNAIIDYVLHRDPSDSVALENRQLVESLSLDEKMRNHPPLDVYIELNTFCNYRCIFCHSITSDDKNMIPLSAIKGLDEMVSAAKMVDITGVGEITLHKEFKQILEYFTERRVPVRFVSNGSNLTKKVCDLILESSVAQLVISVNSLDRENYTTLMGIDGLEKVLQHIEYLSPRFTGALEFSFVINRINFGEIKNFIDFGKKYQRHVACLGLTPIATYPEGLELEYTPETIRKAEEYKEYAKQQGISFWMFNIENQVGTENRTKNLKEVIQGCDWVYSKFFVNTHGDVSPCCWSSTFMGNIYQQSFNEVWHGEKYTELRTLVARGDAKYCAQCRRAG